MSLLANIAGVGVRVKLPAIQAQVRARIVARLGAFVLDGREPTRGSRGREQDGLADADLTLIDERGDISVDGGWQSVHRLDLDLWADADRRRFLVRCAPGRRVDGAVERALRFVVATRLPAAGGLLLHAAAGLGAGGAVAFAGPSGEGKSTVARMIRREALLGDDTVAVRRDGREWVVYSTPFVNCESNLGAAWRAPLWRLFVLQKSGCDRTVTLSKVQRVAAVMQNVVTGLAGSEQRALLDLVTQLVEQVPVWRLERTRDAAVARLMTDRELEVHGCCDGERAVEVGLAADGG